LAINYGCLANLYSRTGNYNKSLEYFKKDLELVKQLGIKKDIHHVQCKYCDLLIKKGLLTTNIQLIDTSITILKDIQDSDPGNLFMAKGLIKSYFVKWWINPGKIISLEYAKGEKEKVETTIEDTNNIYIKAIFNRLFARLAAADGNWDEAMQLFKSASKCFDNLGKESDLPIQKLICDIESFRWQILFDHNSWVEDVIKSVDTLKHCLHTSGFQSESPDIIEDINISLIRKIYRNAKNDTAVLNSNEKCIKLNSILKPLDKLVWYLEI